MFIVIIAIFIILYFYFRLFAPVRKREKGFQYVYIEADGSVRELKEEERDYLTEVFSPNDGARPYIKNRYSELTPDGKLNGFINRRRVPASIKIENL